MAKTPSTRLYDLIHSLSGPEKRYFKLHAQKAKHGQTKYLRLFDAIAAQKDFDEEVLKRAVYGDRQPESRKYSELKNYLYELILHSLQAYDENKDLRNQLWQKLVQAEALFRRSRFADGQEVLEKILEQATRFEWHTLVLEVLDWKLFVAYARADIDSLDAGLDNLAGDIRRWRNWQDEYHQFQYLFLKAFTLVRQSGANQPGLHQQLAALKQHHILAGPGRVQSFRGHIYYHRIWAVIHYGLGDFPAFRASSEDLVGLLESRPDWLEEDPSVYISALNNLSVAYGLERRYEKVEECLEKLTAIRPKTLDDELKIHRQYYANAFRLCIIRGDFDAGYRMLQKHLKTSRKYDQQLFERSSFLFQYFYIAFGKGRYEEALDYLNQWLNLPKTLERQDLQLLARILNLIVHYELGNELLLDYLLRAARRYIGRNEPYRGSEEQMISLFRSLAGKNRKAARKEDFQGIRSQMDQWKEQPAMQSMLRMFDMEAWISSKERGESFARIMEEKYRAEMPAQPGR